MAELSILAGTHKGRKLKFPASAPTRPTSAKVRKSLFDILGDLSELSVLDLFAGTGALGFEAASRRAKAVTFVERDSAAVDSMRKNGLLFSGIDLLIVKQDVFQFLDGCCHSFDLILADPPYGKVDLDRLAGLAHQRLNEGGILVIETSVRAEWRPKNAETRRYGDTRITIFRS